MTDQEKRDLLNAFCGEWQTDSDCIDCPLYDLSRGGICRLHNSKDDLNSLVMTVKEYRAKAKEGNSMNTELSMEDKICILKAFCQEHECCDCPLDDDGKCAFGICGLTDESINEVDEMLDKIKAYNAGIAATDGLRETFKNLNAADHSPIKSEHTTRGDILNSAYRCVCGDREQDYGPPENSFGCIADLWQGYLDGRDFEPLDAADVAAMMVLFKIARVATGHNKSDNWIDAAGYAACGGEIKARESEKRKK